MLIYHLYCIFVSIKCPLLPLIVDYELIVQNLRKVYWKFEIRSTFIIYLEAPVPDNKCLSYNMLVEINQNQ